MYWVAWKRGYKQRYVASSPTRTHPPSDQSLPTHELQPKRCLRDKNWSVKTENLPERKRKARESSTDDPRRCSRGLERGQGEKKATEPELLCPHGLVLRFKKVCEAYLKEKTSYVMRSHMLFTGKVPGARTSAHEFRISCSPWPDHLDNNLHLLLRLASPSFLLHIAFGHLLQY